MELQEMFGRFTANQIKAAFPGITTVEQAQELTDSELLKIPYFGKIKLQKLRNHGDGWKVSNPKQLVIELTKLEYFAARAPKDVPGWFEPKMPEFPIWEKYPIEVFREKESEWHNQREKERIFQWPWYWANLVLENKP